MSERFYGCYQDTIGFKWICHESNNVEEADNWALQHRPQPTVLLSLKLAKYLPSEVNNWRLKNHLSKRIYVKQDSN